MIEKEMAEITLPLFLSAISVPEALLLAEDAHPLPEHFFSATPTWTPLWMSWDEQCG